MRRVDPDPPSTLAMSSPVATRTPPDVGVRDPDLDLPTRRLNRDLDALASFEGYQRLVGNPFLALLALEIGLILCVSAMRTRKLPLCMFAVSSLVFVLYFFQYHCLDCGSTGRLLRWRRHVCEAVRLRHATRRRRRLRGPSPVAQTFLWIAAVFAAFLVALIARL